MIESLRIGPFDIRVRAMTPAETRSRSSEGEFSNAEQEIRLCDQGSGPRAVDTLLHELLHALYWERGIRDSDDEERTVGALATGLTQVLRDNLGLLGWIAEELGPHKPTPFDSMFGLRGSAFEAAELELQRRRADAWEKR